MLIKLYNDLCYYFSNHYFEIVIISCLIFLLIYAIYSKLNGNTGTWSYFKDSPMEERIRGRERDQDDEDAPLKPRRRRGGAPGESKGEIECRRVMSLIFQKPFYKSRPMFLNNPVTFGTNNLELDCFNEELKIAVEYDGKQHYEYIPYFHKSYEAFMNQRYRDYMKEQMCRENGIILIRVPYTVKIEDIQDFLIEKLRQIKL